MFWVNTEIDYYFTVKNYNNEGKKTQNDLKYMIEITPNLDKSIILTLYKDNEVINLNNQKTDYIEMKHDSNEIHTYSNKELVKYRRNDIGFVFQFYNL